MFFLLVCFLVDFDWFLFFGFLFTFMREKENPDYHFGTTDSRYLTQNFIL